MIHAPDLRSAPRTERIPRAAVVVAHPDDETLWCGGMMLAHQQWYWQVVTVCRGSNPDRSRKFRKVMRHYGAAGTMGDLDDGSEQRPLVQGEIRETISDLLPAQTYDLVLTHGPAGESTRHRQPEECCRAVVAMWQSGEISARELWLFAYEAAEDDCLPRASGQASRHKVLSDSTWQRKRQILLELYGFAADSWEVQVTPRVEGFFCFQRPADARRHLAATHFTH